jgi:protein-S-isoprenylcysteine O-methyltransferase Ste14
VPEDSTLRVALVIALPLLILVAAYHRIRAHRASPEPLDRRQEGWFILATLRPAALVFFVAFVAYLVNPASMSWASVPLPLWMRWTGIAALLMNIAFLWWTMHSLGRNLTDTVVTRRNHQLVTHGPYRWIRHPFYDSIAFMMLGLTLAAANWFMFAAGLVFMSLMVLRTGREEDRLVARFGDAYRSYMARTGRFLPKVRAR